MAALPTVSTRSVLPDLSDDVCARLREAFRRTSYDADGVVAALGGTAHAALGRGEPVPAERASRDAGDLGTLIRLFLLGGTEPETAVKAAFAPLSPEDAVAAGVLDAVDGGYRAALDIRPHGDDEGSWWVVSDLDADVLGSTVPEDHVLGVGHASLSLIRATSRRPVGTLLDLGTGNGVQALHATRHAQRVTATDVSARALALAAATFRLNELDVELVRGEWFAPVARRKFDQVVCNPPFVVGPARVDYTYRDSGLAGDDASALVVRQLPGFLNDGGVGQLLASWLHTGKEDWADRVSRWLPAETDAWFVQRDVADPALYVGTWLRDAGLDPRSPEGRAKAAAWLDWFAANDVRGIGFGFVTLRRAAGRHADRRLRGPAAGLRRPARPGSGRLAGPRRLAARIPVHCSMSVLWCPTRFCWKASKNRATKAGRPPSGGCTAPTGRAGSTRSTTWPRSCWPAAAARYRWRT